jgi:hypothetical protein
MIRMLAERGRAKNSNHISKTEPKIIIDNHLFVLLKQSSQSL